MKNLYALKELKREQDKIYLKQKEKSHTEDKIK